MKTMTFRKINNGYQTFNIEEFLENTKENEKRLYDEGLKYYMDCWEQYPYKDYIEVEKFQIFIKQDHRKNNETTYKSLRKTETFRKETFQNGGNK